MGTLYLFLKRFALPSWLLVRVPALADSETLLVQQVGVDEEVAPG